MFHVTEEIAQSIVIIVIIIVIFTHTITNTIQASVCCHWQLVLSQRASIHVAEEAC